MNDNAKKWIEALRSGDYAQTKGKLRDKTGYCCLGVACDISGLAKWEPTGTDVFTYDGCEGYLPSKVWDLLGLRGGAQDKLISLNDGGAPFTYIADTLTENATAYFEA